MADNMRDKIGVSIVKLRLFMGGALSKYDLDDDTVNSINYYFDRFEDDIIKIILSPPEGK